MGWAEYVACKRREEVTLEFGREICRKETTWKTLALMG
jgi:hypothetical protein